MRKGRQTGIGQALNGLVRKLDKGTGGAYRQSSAKQAWVRTAGPSVLSHTTGAHLRGNELVVFVDSGVWATELTALAGHYLESLNEDLGKGSVASIRFTVSRKVAEELRIERIERLVEEDRAVDKVDSVELTETERAQVESSVAGIADPELREAVLRATVADLEWKKGLRNPK